MAENPNPQNDGPAELSFEDRLAAARPVTVEDLDAMAIEDLTGEEWRALHEALSASWKSAEAGRLRPASAILDELRHRR